MPFLEKCDLMNQSPKGPRTIEGYPTWRERRDNGYEISNMMGPENKMPQENTIEDYFEKVRARQKIYS